MWKACPNAMLEAMGERVAGGGDASRGIPEGNPGRGEWIVDKRSAMRRRWRKLWRRLAAAPTLYTAFGKCRRPRCVRCFRRRVRSRQSRRIYRAGNTCPEIQLVILDCLTHGNTLFKANRAWAAQMKAEEPDFFEKLVGVQTPKYLWIGCSDSRVLVNEILGLKPGEVLSTQCGQRGENHTDFQFASPYCSTRWRC